jgi:hypothetical protein
MPSLIDLLLKKNSAGTDSARCDAYLDSNRSPRKDQAFSPRKVSQPLDANPVPQRSFRFGELRLPFHVVGGTYHDVQMAFLALG